MDPVIKYPEITKNTSTPTYPPGKDKGKAWNKTTDATAKALRPCISFLLKYSLNLKDFMNYTHNYYQRKPNATDIRYQFS